MMYNEPKMVGYQGWFILGLTSHGGSNPPSAADVVVIHHFVARNAPHLTKAEAAEANSTHYTSEYKWIPPFPPLILSFLF